MIVIIMIITVTIIEITASLRSRRLEVVDKRDTRGVFPLACLLLARPFFRVPTTSKRLLRRL